ncbi:glutaminyl-peptide cyclotransferase [soil metagenome]
MHSFIKVIALKLKRFSTFVDKPTYILMTKYFLLAALVLFSACSNRNNDTEPATTETPVTGIAAPQNITLNIIGIYPHDTSAYTQGLEIYKGKLYEGTGDYETSSLRITDIKTGKVEHKHMMGTSKIFGEGITIFNNKIYQLTWQSHVVNVYDLNNIDKPVQTFNWPYEGWGITHNDKELIISDGSANFYFVNPADFRIRTTIQVTDNAGPVNNLNELEMINGFVFANVYTQDFIVKVDPASGNVVGRIDLPGLKDQYFKNQVIADRTDVLNGIAYDSTSKKIYITGKRWPKMFEAYINQ